MAKNFYPPVGYYFAVFTEKHAMRGRETAFREVSGITAAMNTQPLQEGGVNWMSRQLPGITSYENLELKRGLITMNSQLSAWCFSTFGHKSTGKTEPKLVTLQLLNEEGNPLMVWQFHDAYPVKWDVSGFNAQESSIVVESLTLTYNYFTVENELDLIPVNDEGLSGNKIF